MKRTSSRPDFTMLIYPGGFEEKGQARLRDHIRVTGEAPPTFFVHAFDDGVTVLNTLLLAAELKKAGVSAEAHVYASGGHGYGLRRVEGQPVTEWPTACATWMRSMGYLK